jgi:dihydrodipicolinate synthase/N-acetylneuraminate lyase
MRQRPRHAGVLSGAIAAAATPLTDGGASIDEAAIEPLVRFLAAAGLDGALTLGTTGEGVLLSVAERRAVAGRFIAAAPSGFAVAVHCGAQTTADTVALASHAAEAGAAAVAVIAPPYFPLDGRAILAHFLAAARACAPIPFYVYEFEARSGYVVPVPVIHELRSSAPNLAGMKVSDAPFSAVERYLGLDLDIFVGLEPLVIEGLRAGAAGAVSGLATAFPEVVAALVHDRELEAHRHVEELRVGLGEMPFQAAMKHVLGCRGVPVGPDVRAPLRGLTPGERSAVEALL